MMMMNLFEDKVLQVRQYEDNIGRADDNLSSSAYMAVLVFCSQTYIYVSAGSVQDRVNLVVMTLT